MKHLLALTIFALSCLSAFAQTKTVEYWLTPGTAKVSTQTACDDAAVAATAAGAEVVYDCVRKVRVKGKAAPVLTFAKIANEGDAFTVTAGSTVRFGKDTRWIQKTISGASTCTLATFGGDPAVNVAKECQVANGSAVVPPVVPANPFPNGETKTVACPTGQTGSWTQTRTYAYSAGSNTWAAGAWTPTTAPAGACAAPPTSSLLPVVDRAKIPAPAVGSAGPRVQAAPSPFANGDNQGPNPSDIGAFRLGCTFSHMNFDDPIVYPGQAGASHLHTYVGNTAVGSGSTSDTIANSGASTCAGGTLNRSGYWFPAMIDTTDGTPLVPSGFLVYYKTGYGGVKPANVQPVPAGLRFISGSSAGNPTAPSNAGRFTCVGGEIGVGWQATIPANCQQYNSLIMEVEFPQCWDGVNLDSPDHKSHMAETNGSGCPSTHPVALPKISYEIYYDLAKVKLANMKNWRLSSDNYATTNPGGYSAHGDYVLGWDKPTMEKFIKNCDQTSYDCHTNLLGDGTWLY